MCVNPIHYFLTWGKKNPVLFITRVYHSTRKLSVAQILCQSGDPCHGLTLGGVMIFKVSSSLLPHGIA